MQLLRAGGQPAGAASGALGTSAETVSAKQGLRMNCHAPSGLSADPILRKKRQLISARARSEY